MIDGFSQSPAQTYFYQKDIIANPHGINILSPHFPEYRPL